ncbi:MAG: MotA/TolQ/ExbB proton channel family protein [Planctomyces sp.]|nr:MotA/TolQ/ExbB proton channel family protein [Planctomyces sp.]
MTSNRHRSRMLRRGACLLLLALWAFPALAQTEAAPPADERGIVIRNGQLDVRELLRAGGVIGGLTILLSLGMVAMIVEQLLTIRRGALIPAELPEKARALIAAGKIGEAEALARDNPSYLGFLLQTGLQEIDLGYAAVEKSMEDAAVEQSARLFRKVEYLAVIGAVAPMLGLMGTVWGMIQAFGEFAERANPQPADFAPSISEALVTTLFGLVVAVPAISAFAFFRNKVDELSAEATITAGHVMAPLKRQLPERARPQRDGGKAPAPDAPRPPIPPVVAEREPRR